MGETGREPIVTDEKYTDLLKQAQVLVMALTQKNYLAAKVIADDIGSDLYRVERRVLEHLKDDAREKVTNMIGVLDISGKDET